MLSQKEVPNSSSQFVNGLQPLAARLPELAIKLERLYCFRLFYSEWRRISEQVFNQSIVEWAMIRNCWGWPEIAGRQTGVTKLHVSAVWSFLQKMLLIVNTQLNWRFLSLFHFLCLKSAFVSNIMSFIEALARLRICLFRCVFSLNLGKRLVLVQF